VRLTWQPRAEGFGFDHALFYRPDRLLSLGFGRISARICRGLGRSMRNRLLADHGPQQTSSYWLQSAEQFSIP
jgi:hypothetical protein